MRTGHVTIRWIAVGAILGAIGVALGAYGAHGLEKQLAALGLRGRGSGQAAGQPRDGRPLPDVARTGDRAGGRRAHDAAERLVECVRRVHFCSAC